jgi:hypothetical protein
LGNPVVAEHTCTPSNLYDYDCTVKFYYSGEGKTFSQDMPFLDYGNDDGWGYDDAISASGQWVYLSLRADNTAFPPLTVAALVAGGTPAGVAKSNPTIAKVGTSVKKGKTLSMPVKTKQNHPITWAVSSKSKKICSVTLTKVNGEVTKVVVKGLKVGTCTLTAKASAGFFYKALNKTIAIKVK